MSEKINEACWYVVHTYSGYENKVKDTLEKSIKSNGMQDFIFEVRVPVEEVTEIRKGKRVKSQRKVFPGYVIVKMIKTNDSWYVVRNTRGVTGFVGSANNAIPLTEEEVLALGMERREIVVAYKVGDQVKITDGPLSTFLGVVDEIEPEKNRVCVVVSMFGRETPVELELDQVEVVD